MLSAARKSYKITFSKVSFNISCNKNRLKTENIFLQEESVAKKTKTTIKKLRVGDLNLGTVGNRKHTYFFCLALLKKSLKNYAKECVDVAMGTFRANIQYSQAYNEIRCRENASIQNLLFETTTTTTKDFIYTLDYNT